jgi:hypothetical protein
MFHLFDCSGKKQVMMRGGTFHASSLSTQPPFVDFGASWIVRSSKVLSNLSPKIDKIYQADCISSK